MKNKKTVYILLPIVLLIWGAVMYQFFSFSTIKEEQKTNFEKFIFKPIDIKKRDTIVIDINYRDPFLGKIYAETEGKKYARNKIVKPKKPAVIINPIVWPTINYKGIVSDTNENNKVFMLIINGKTFLMKKGEIENEIFLKEGDRESIYVKYKGILNIILLQQ